jgi:hypothetical protein
MLCYKDKTFCPYHLLCKDGPKCEDALTRDVFDKAQKAGLDISQYVNYPKCFKRFFDAK